MSLIIRNISPGSVEIEDLGITLVFGDNYDLTDESAASVASSTNLISAVNADQIIALDPLDDVTPLTKTQSIVAIQSANDTHFRIRGGELTQLDDVDLTGLTDGYQLTYDSGSGNWIPAPPGGTSSGEANTASNLGGGQGWYAQKVGVDLQFKSIVAGNALTLTPSATEIQVDVNESEISHLNISDIGTNTHAQIDSHIADGTIHFTEGSISHLNIQDIGVNSHSAIDTHIADSTIHFTEASIDHTNILNIGTNTHAQIDTHIADTANPHMTNIVNLTDTLVSSVANGEALLYNSTTGKWENEPLAVAGSGRLIQVLFGPIPAVSSTASIPMGTAAPLVTDGVEIWSTTMAPTATNSNVRIGTSFSFDFSQNNTELIVAFFRDAVCIGSALMTGTTKKFPVQFTTTIYDQPNTTLPVVYSCRVGKVTGVTFYINRTQDLIAALGGTLESQAYTVEEIGVSP